MDFVTMLTTILVASSSNIKQLCIPEWLKHFLPRIGGILCPYINMLSDTWTPLPLIIYGVFAFTG